MSSLWVGRSGIGRKQEMVRRRRKFQANAGESVRQEVVCRKVASSNKQQQLSPAQRLARALQGIRQVQNMLELQAPQQGNAIAMLREAGDLVWGEIQILQQQQQQKQQ